MLDSFPGAHAERCSYSASKLTIIDSKDTLVIEGDGVHNGLLRCR